MVEYQFKEEIDIELPGNIILTGDLIIPVDAEAIVIFAHGSGSSRLSSRNRFVARKLHEAGFATLLFDLLTMPEGEDYPMRFDIALLSDRLVSVTKWLEKKPGFDLPIGYFGASTGAAAALSATARLGDEVKAIVSRGGRPDLAMTSLARVVSPTLLIVGSLDEAVIPANQKALTAIHAEKDMRIVPGATHLFEEPGKLEVVAQLAAEWFSKYLKFAHA